MNLENLKLMEKGRIFLAISAALVFASLVSVFIFGLNPGIDLKGGTEWHIFMTEDVGDVELEMFLLDEFGVSASAQHLGDEGDVVIRLPETTEDERVAYEEGLSGEFGEVSTMSFTSIGPVIGQELRRKSFWAAGGVVLGIFLFVAWAFRKASKPINSWKYGAAAIATLIHDVGITLGFFATLGYFYGVQIDTTIIVALLVVLGFSVNDTIVVFDRIRENTILYKNTNMPLDKVFDKSIRQTVMRSINTSLTLIMVLLSLIFIGPSTLTYFMLTILVGTIVGTYSSIFVASPLLYEWGKR